MVKVLTVDDEESICGSIDMNLTAAGYHRKAVQDDVSALKMVEGESFGLVLLDMMLPGVDSCDIMKYIHPLEVPVIFMTVKHEVKDRVKGLRLGADDYLVKPFDMMELTARVEAVLRRYNRTEHPPRTEDVTVDVETRMIARAGRLVVLTNRKSGLLLLFIRNRSVVLFRETLYEKVWEGECSGNSHTLDLHMQRLRRELGQESSLMAVYEVGYHLEVPQ